MTKFNKQVFDKLVKARAKGHTLEECAFLAGIHRVTLMRWLEFGKNGQQPFQAFYRRFERGKAQAAGVLLDTLYDQAIAGCRSSAFFLLERVHGRRKDPPPPPPIQINIEADRDVAGILNEYHSIVQPLLSGPVIDLDEE